MQLTYSGRVALDPVRPVGATASCQVWQEQPVGIAPPLPMAPPLLTCPSLLVKEEEKQKLLQRGSELQSERQQLEERDRRLASAVKVCWRKGEGEGRGRGQAALRTTRLSSKASLSGY